MNGGCQYDFDRFTLKNSVGVTLHAEFLCSSSRRDIFPLEKDVEKWYSYYMDYSAVDKLQEIVDRAKRLVFFGGAGVSTESGIPDFRSKDGLYSQKYKFPPEYMLSHDCFSERTEDFFEFYRDKIISYDAKPNAAHRFLACLEKAGRLGGIVTQNIDGLHYDAGSKRVYELHGSIRRNYCTRCGRAYDLAFMRASEGVPMCACGGIVKPDVVLYGEGLDDDVVSGAIRVISEADAMIIAGTSLTVYPAAGLIRYFRGRDLVVINLGDAGEVPGALIIHQKVGEVLGQIKIK